MKLKPLFSTGASMADIIAILASPQNWFLGAAVIGVPVNGYIAYEIASFHYRHKGYEPAIDLDALQAELDRELAALSSHPTASTPHTSP
jgi:hypothetical protein